jgi:hypothetical protein
MNVSASEASVRAVIDVAEHKKKAGSLRRVCTRAVPTATPIAVLASRGNSQPVELPGRKVTLLGFRQPGQLDTIGGIGGQVLGLDGELQYSADELVSLAYP